MPDEGSPDERPGSRSTSFTIFFSICFFDHELLPPTGGGESIHPPEMGFRVPPLPTGAHPGTPVRPDADGDPSVTVSRRHVSACSIRCLSSSSRLRWSRILARFERAATAAEGSRLTLAGSRPSPRPPAFPHVWLRRRNGRSCRRSARWRLRDAPARWRTAEDRSGPSGTRPS
jgi:hypothetical protein